jgi:hypothetical protein
MLRPQPSLIPQRPLAPGLRKETTSPSQLEVEGGAHDGRAEAVHNEDRHIGNDFARAGGEPLEMKVFLLGSPMGSVLDR